MLKDISKKLRISVLDEDSKYLFSDDSIFIAISKLLTEEISIDEFYKTIDLLRFEQDLKVFKENGGEAIDFYFSRKKEIESDIDKRAKFINYFNIFSTKKLKQIIAEENNYPKEFFDENLRKQILESQENKCKLCGSNLIKPHLHHIDYNKKNCDRSNLVFLCPRCHGKTNKNREFWSNFLKEDK